MEIRAIVLTDDLEKADQQIEVIEKKEIAGHFDVIDGKFVNVKTVRPQQVKKNIKGDWECHLMVDNPATWIDECMEAGFGRIIGQIEKMDDQSKFVEEVQRLQMEAGLALDFGTQIELLDGDALVWVDRVLILGVRAGKSGQKFEDSVIQKIEFLINLRKTRGFGFVIEVDGGITLEIARRLKDMGVECLAINSAFWKGDCDDNWEKFSEQMN